MAIDQDRQILERLDTLIRLQALSMVDRYKSTKDKILFLGGAGLTPKEIAELLNTTSNSVSVTLSKDRGKKSKSKQRAE